MQSPIPLQKALLRRTVLWQMPHSVTRWVSQKYIVDQSVSATENIRESRIESGWGSISYRRSSKKPDSLSTMHPRRSWWDGLLYSESRTYSTRSGAIFQTQLPGISSSESALLSFANPVRRYKPHIKFSACCGVLLLKCRRPPRANHVYGAAHNVKVPGPYHASTGHNRFRACARLAA